MSSDEPKNSNLDELPLSVFPLQKLEKASPTEILKWGFETFGTKLVLGTGFGPSGIVLIHHVYQLKLPIEIFYLDTNLLFAETYQLCADIEKKFNLNITRVEAALSLEEQAEQYGEKLWERDPDLCCHIRKVVPLCKFLGDKSAWITGVRRDQSKTRKQTKVIEKDLEKDVIKINPMAHWSSEQVWEYIRHHKLPYNPLHDQGYASIGCVPLTEKINPGEAERAGRWRGSEKTECGIHLASQKNEQKLDHNLKKPF